MTLYGLLEVGRCKLDSFRNKLVWVQREAQNGKRCQRLETLEIEGRQASKKGSGKAVLGLGDAGSMLDSTNSCYRKYVV